MNVEEAYLWTQDWKGSQISYFVDKGPEAQRGKATSHATQHPDSLPNRI